MTRIPYGTSSFATLRAERSLFVDQTRFIRRLEEDSHHILFLRPRRFGKSLWLSILEHYYDVRFADRFEELFGGLDIGREPTPLASRFLVLKLDFSAVDTTGDDEQLRESLASRVRLRIGRFLDDHGPWLGPRAARDYERIEDIQSPVDLLEVALEAARRANLPVYVLIDEYDNFTNELIAGRQEERYKSLVRGTGLLRVFFKAIKEATQGKPVARTFTTGINPILLSDLTSGFNISTTLGAEPEFAELLGFGLEDVRSLLGKACEDLTPAQASTLGDADRLLELMVQWYDGYRFDPAGPPRFNPDMVLYMLRAVALGRMPRQLVDFNLTTDIAKLGLVVRKAGDLGRLQDRIEDRTIPGTLVSDHFGIDDLVKPIHFDSLLYYLGFLSYAKGPRPQLRIPNYVIRTLYWEELRELIAQGIGVPHLEPVRVALSTLMESDDAEPFFRLVLEQVLALAVPRYLIHMSEAAIKTACLALLSLSGELMVFSEWATHRGYADLVLIPAPQSVWLSRAWMIELKSLSKSADTPAAREKALAEGRAQLERYCQDEARMAYLTQWELNRAVVLFVGVEEVVVEGV